jgi:sulfite exporter TauE/SafE
MCGPLAAAAGRRSPAASLQYAGGRILSYGLLGCLAGSFGRVLLASAAARWVELLACIALSAVLVRIGCKLLARRADPRASTQLLSLGRAPRRSRVGRLLAELVDEPLLLGAATALLPCGALLTALAAAAAAGTALSGAVLMLTFAALTGVALQLATRLTRGLALRPLGSRVLAGVFFAGALVTLARPVLSHAAGHPACHGPTRPAATATAGTHGAPERAEEPR